MKSDKRAQNKDAVIKKRKSQRNELGRVFQSMEVAAA